MKYSVNEEGVQALNTMANAICSAADDIGKYTSQIQMLSDEHCDSIGPHKSSLDAALSEISDNVVQSISPVNDISALLHEVAEGYQVA